MRLGTFYRYVLLKNIGALGTKKNGAILDVGGFDGYILSGLDSKEKTLIDPFLKESYDGIRYIKRDFLEYDFKAETFDNIFSLDVIEHLPRKDENTYFVKIFSLLNKGGTAVITAPSKSISVFPDFLTGYVSRKWGHDKCRGYSKKELSKLLGDSGIKKFELNSLNSRAYLGFYLAVRFMRMFLPERVWKKIITVMANRDAKLEDNESIGYYYIRIIK